ncbi:MAG TPA: cupin domain-containing protein [Acidimicrobiales bacterium]|nr:cupin domain-containing protein [Acidimicrobiales bacterium]
MAPLDPGVDSRPARPPAAIVVRAQEAEEIEFPDGSSMRLLTDSATNGGTLSVHRATLRPGGLGASPHHHLTATEMFYVLSGSVQLLVGEVLVMATEGDLAVVPPGMAHAFAAAPGGDAELIVAVTPGIERFELFRRLARLAAGLEEPGTLPHDQSHYDTYASDSPAWRQATR